MKIVEKPWGKQIRFCENEHYACMVVHLKKGSRTSLHYHKIRYETVYVHEGSIKYVVKNQDGELTERVLKAGEAVDNTPYLVHRLVGLEDSVLIEVMTPPLDDSIRIEDDYERPLE